MLNKISRSWPAFLSAAGPQAGWRQARTQAWTQAWTQALTEGWTDAGGETLARVATLELSGLSERARRVGVRGAHSGGPWRARNLPRSRL